MNVPDRIRKPWRPLESRKVRVALATIIAAFAANWGFDVDEELVLTILGVGASLILGIAHEDTARQPPLPTGADAPKTEVSEGEDQSPSPY